MLIIAHFDNQRIELQAQLGSREPRGHLSIPSSPPAGLRNVEPEPRDKALRWPFWDLGRSRYPETENVAPPLPAVHR